MVILYPTQNFEVYFRAIRSPPIDRSRIMNRSGFWLGVSGLVWAGHSVF